MNRKKVELSLATVFMIALFALASVNPAYAQSRDVIFLEYSDIEEKATRLHFEIDQNNEKHFSYVIGDKISEEPLGQPFESNYLFKYGKINQVTNTSSAENVTDAYVFPYHYDFVIDSTGRVHTTYIGEGYTLFYAVRGTDGTWVHKQVTTPDEWFAMAPVVRLGENDQPRIAYKVVYKDGASDYYGIGYSISGLRALHYAYSEDDGNTWTTFDVANNHGLAALSSGTLAYFESFNPSFEIANGTVYMAYSVRVSIAAETRMRYLHFPELPGDEYNTGAKDFLDSTHMYAIISSTIATIYTKPKILFYGSEGIVILAGTVNFGGAAAMYMLDRYEEPADDLEVARSQIAFSELESSLRNKEALSIDAVSDDEVVHVMYAVYNLFDAENQEFVQDIKLVSFNPANAGFEQLQIFRATNELNVEYRYPNIEINSDGKLETLFVRVDSGTSKLATQFIAPPTIFASTGWGAFIFTILIFGGIIFGWYTFVKKMRIKEEEIEILPHMINLREEITEN